MDPIESGDRYRGQRPTGVSNFDIRNLTSRQRRFDGKGGIDPPGS